MTGTKIGWVTLSLASSQESRAATGTTATATDVHVHFGCTVDLQEINILVEKPVAADVPNKVCKENVKKERTSMI